MNRIGFILNVSLIVFILGFHSSASQCQAQGHIWAEKYSMPDILWGHSSCEMDGKVYILGGRNIFAFPIIPLNTVWMYDPLLDTCITKANMDSVRTGFSTCIYNGKIYAIGGAQRVYGSVPNLTTKSIEAYDPELDSWTHITNMPLSRYDHTASLVGSKIYILGGYDNVHTEPFSQVDIFDLATETWTIGSPMPTPRVQLSSVVLNGKIYAIGGHRGLSTNESGEKTVEVYDPATDMWSDAADLVSKLKMMSACTLNGKIYVFGGTEGYCTPALSGMQAYIPETDSWKKIGDMPRKLVLPSSVVANNKIYITGGFEGDCSTYEMLSSIYEFVPDTNVFTLEEEYVKERTFIFPNPVDNITYVEIENTTDATIDISTYKAGMYLIKIKQNCRNYLKKELEQNSIQILKKMSKIAMS